MCEQAYKTLLETTNVRSHNQIDIIPLWGNHSIDLENTDKSQIYVVTLQKLANLIAEVDFQFLLSMTI